MNKINDYSVFHVIKLLIQFLMQSINIQHILFFFVILTFDIGDALTGSWMMDINGIGAEYNIIFRYIYANEGLMGLIIIKFSLIILPLIIVSMVNKTNYWTINGILVAFIVPSILSIQANMQAISGQPAMSPNEIIYVYIKLMVILMIAGSLMDSIILKTEKKKEYVKISNGTRVKNNNFVSRIKDNCIRYIKGAST